MKTYLESDNRGLTMRTAFVDITMPQEQQTGKKSRRICKDPPAPQRLFGPCTCRPSVCSGLRATRVRVLSRATVRG